MPEAKTANPAAISTPQVRIELRSNMLLLSGARELVASVAKRLGFTDESCGQLALAVDEALTNVIRHGYQRDPWRPIWLTIYAVGNGWDGAEAPGAARAGVDCVCSADGPYPDSLRIVIEDEAPQIDPAAIKSRDLNDVRPGGLGVHIIKSVMDEATYERREKVGMRLTMVKSRTSTKRLERANEGAENPPVGGCRGSGTGPSCPGGAHG